MFVLLYETWPEWSIVCLLSHNNFFYTNKSAIKITDSLKKKSRNTPTSYCLYISKKKKCNLDKVIKFHTSLVCENRVVHRQLYTCWDFVTFKIKKKYVQRLNYFFKCEKIVWQNNMLLFFFLQNYFMKYTT